MGGGFCEIHGPYDPPHHTCPFCAQEDAQRREFGPPPDGAPADEPDFVRQTVEHVAEPPAERDESAKPDPPDLPPTHKDDPTKDDLTQIAQRQVFAGDALAEDEIEEPSWIEHRPEPLGWLIVKAPGEQRGEIVPVRANQIIGRQGDIRWADPLLSRHHARFTFEPAEDAPDDGPVFHLWPFGPTNPVTINGQLIRGATPVHENDEIYLGDTLFVFKTLLD
jgi:pSer/pThr/pTyr-binding forkhead associated (FHA) protein